MDGITNTMDMSLSKLQEMVKGREAWCAAVQADAHKAHEDRMSEISRMENAPETRDWMCEPVPDDVCMLFDSGPLFAD